MNSTFSRAVVGFVVLTAALTCMAMIAIWGIALFAPSLEWASLIVVAIALVAEISIYANTLHDPIHRWIKEPEEERMVEGERSIATRIAKDLMEEHVRKHHAEGV